MAETPATAMAVSKRRRGTRLNARLGQLFVYSVIIGIVSLLRRLGMGELLDFEKENKEKTEGEKEKGQGGRYTAIKRLLRNNAMVYILGYGLPYLAFHCTTYFWKRKFNQRPTHPEIFRKELRRWCVSCCIGAAVDFSTRRASAIGLLPRLDTREMSFPRRLLEVLFVSEWSDIHFYLLHRFLHVGPSWLYTNIHSVHHQSYNPNPFSGLSFHPLESLTYFSSVPMYLMLNAVLDRPTNAFAYVALKLLNDVGPSAGHDGYTSSFHYLHHTKKHWNFGASPRWDKYFGTLLVENPFKSKWAGTP